MNQAEQLKRMPFEEDDERFVALGYIDTAWADALEDGVEPDAIAHAALFMALADLVAAYGEDSVADLVSGLPDKIRVGEYSLDRELH
ncbi:MAG: hypothetical protein AAGL24_23800 [Pseudomonadota bacterium]